MQQLVAVNREAWPKFLQPDRQNRCQEKAEPPQMPMEKKAHLMQMMAQPLTA
jgi:hypothetical protein